MAQDFWSNVEIKLSMKSFNSLIQYFKLFAKVVFITHNNDFHFSDVSPSYLQSLTANCSSAFCDCFDVMRCFFRFLF